MGISVEKFCLEGPALSVVRQALVCVKIEREPACRRNVSDRNNQGDSEGRVGADLRRGDGVDEKGKERGGQLGFVYWERQEF